jgi:RNA polymerase-binding transcription factor DksA
MAKRFDDATARRRLEHELERCLRQAEVTSRPDEAASEAAMSGADIVDRIQAHRIQRDQVAVARRVATRIAAIRAALARLADGRYGECVRCSGDIARARLFAVPEVATCIACQEDVERETARRIA